MDKKDYATITIDKEAIAAATSDENSFVRLVGEKMRASSERLSTVPDPGYADGRVHAEQYKPVVISDASYSPTTMNPVEVQKHELEVQQTKALASLAEGVNAIAAFITGGGMSELLSGYARTQAVQSILGGLASHDGRNALDARVLGQNAVEIVEQIEKVFDKYHSRKTSEKRDPVIHTEDDRPREGETREEYGVRMKAKKDAGEV